jgi:hypothetical protein
MKIGRLKEMLVEMDENEEIYVAFYTKEEAQEHIQENFNEGDEFPLTDEQWQDIILSLDNEDGIHDELNNAWEYYLEKLFTKLKNERVSNDNSK